VGSRWVTARERASAARVRGLVGQLHEGRGGRRVWLGRLGPSDGSLVHLDLEVQPTRAHITQSFYRFRCVL
jgi:hypothetical protein